MKYNLIIAAVCVALTAFVSCNTEKELSKPVICREQGITITAIHADGTYGKTTLDNGGDNIYWQPGDAIKLFRGNNCSNLTADISENSKVATFSGLKPAGEGEFIAVYPSNLASGCTNGVISLTIPSVQEAKAGSFAPETYITMGHSTTTEMGFYSVCGGFRFTLSQEGITRIAFETKGEEKIAGAARVKFIDGLPSLQDPSSTLSYNRIVLNAPEGESFQTGKWYYIVAAPAVLSQGYKLSFFKEGLFGAKVFSNTVEIKRGVIGSKQNVDSGVNFAEYDYVDLGLSVKWATFNVGSTTSEEYGDYFAWGETKPKSVYSWDTYKYANGDSNHLIKYCQSSMTSYWDGSGLPDNIDQLEQIDDVAYVFYGHSWRTPRIDEWKELKDDCEWMWTSINGVSGYRISGKKDGYQDKWIFLPAAGRRNNNSVALSGYCCYWSSSVANYPFEANCYYGKKGQALSPISIMDRCGGYSIRPVYGDSRVNSVAVNKNSLFLDIDEYKVLRAIVKPTNATNTGVIWSSSDASIAAIDQFGKVIGKKEGNAVITVTTVVGGHTSSCMVTVKNYPDLTETGKVFETVDLGLSVEWATFNIGAGKPEETGDFFAWGELATKHLFNRSTYHWCNNSGLLTKYCRTEHSSYWAGPSSPDNLTQLEFEDDAAIVYLGGHWRMPTKDEIDELSDRCSWEWTQVNGVNGFVITSCIEGYTDKFIFFPAAGCKNDTEVGDNQPNRALCWSSSLSGLSDRGFCIYYENNRRYAQGSSGTNRVYGLPIRPVYE